jgi:hypothetical protein
MFDLPDQIVSAEELSFSSDFVIRYALEDTNAASFDGVTFYGTFTYRIAANYPTFGEDISAFTAHPNILGSPSGSDVAKCKIDVVALAGRTRITSGYNATVDNFGLFSVDKTSADVLCNAHLHLHLPHLYSLFSYVSDRDSRKLYISGSLTNYKCISAGQYTNTGKT